MPRGSGDVRVTVGAEVSDLRRGMNEAGSAVKEFAEGSKRGASRVREFSEILTTLTGDSGAAGKALGVFGGVLGGLAAGGLVGAGVAAVGGLVQVFKDLGRESAEAAKATRESAQSAADAALGLSEVVNEIYNANRGVAGRELDLLRNQAEMRRMAAKSAKEIADTEAQITEARKSGNAAAQSSLLAQLDSQRRAYDALSDLERAREKKINERWDKQDADEKERADKKAREDRERIEKELKAQDAALESYRNKKSPFDMTNGNAAEAREAEMEAQAEKAREEAKKTIAEREQDEKELAERLQKIDDKWAEDDKKKAQERLARYQQIGDQLGSMMGGLITGQQTFGQVIAQVGQMMVQQITQAAIASVTGHAAGAAAGAAESQAGIPVIGPVLAISAMGAMLSAVMGLLGNIGSAEGGWDLPAGGPFPAVLHSREMVLPREQADAIRSMSKGGGGGGATLNVNVTTPDSRSFDRMLTGNHRGLRDASRRLARLGRI